MKKKYLLIFSLLLLIYQPIVSQADDNLKVFFSVGGIRMSGIKAELYTGDGQKFGMYSSTNDNGEVDFMVPPGDYTVKFKYLNNVYWTDTVKFPEKSSVVLDIKVINYKVNFFIKKGFMDEPIENLLVYVLDNNNSFIGTKDLVRNGTIKFVLPTGIFKIGFGYMGNNYIYLLSENQTVELQEYPVKLLTDNLDKSSLQIKVLNLQNSKFPGITREVSNLNDSTIYLPKGSYKIILLSYSSKIGENDIKVPDNTEVSFSNKCNKWKIKLPVNSKGMKLVISDNNGKEQIINKNKEICLTPGTYKVLLKYFGFKFYLDNLLANKAGTFVAKLPGVVKNVQLFAKVNDKTLPIDSGIIKILSNSGNFTGVLFKVDNGYAKVWIPPMSVKFQLEYNGSTSKMNIDSNSSRILISAGVIEIQSDIPGTGTVYLLDSKGKIVLKKIPYKAGKTEIGVIKGKYKIALKTGAKYHISDILNVDVNEIKKVFFTDSVKSESFQLSLVNNKDEPINHFQYKFYDCSNKIIKTGMVDNSISNFNWNNKICSIEMKYFSFDFIQKFSENPQNIKLKVTAYSPLIKLSSKKDFKGVPWNFVNYKISKNNFSVSGNFKRKYNNLPYVPVGTYKLTVFTPTYSKEYIFNINSSGNLLKIEIPIGQAEIHIFKNGKPIVSQELIILSGKEGIKITTDSKGKAVIPLPVGKYRVIINKEGKSFGGEIVIKNNKLSRFKFNLK